MRLKLGGAHISSAVKACCVSALAGLAVCTGLLAVCALGIWQGRLPEDITRELTLGCAMAGAVVSGMAMKGGEGRGALRGLAGGMTLMAAAALIGAYRSQGGYFDLDFIRLAICCVAGGAFGGIIHTGKKTKKRSNTRKKYTKSNH